MSLSEIVRKTRTDQNMTLEEFATALGITRQAVSHWETGKRTPDISFLLLASAQNSDWRRAWAQNCLAALKPDVFAPAQTTTEIDKSADPLG